MAYSFLGYPRGIGLGPETRCKSTQSLNFRWILSLPNPKRLKNPIGASPGMIPASGSGLFGRDVQIDTGLFSCSPLCAEKKSGAGEFDAGECLAILPKRPCDWRCDLLQFLEYSWEIWSFATCITYVLSMKGRLSAPRFKRIDARKLWGHRHKSSRVLRPHRD